MPAKLTGEIIAAAFEGSGSQKQRIDGQIAGLQKMLDGGPAKFVATPEAPAGKRKKFSAATRGRMKEAQQRRWAAIKGESEVPPVTSSARPIDGGLAVSTKGKWTMDTQIEQSGSELMLVENFR